MPNINNEKHCIWILEKIKTDKFFCVAVSSLQTSTVGFCSQKCLLRNNYKVLYYKAANVEPSESETEILSTLEWLVH